MLGLLGLLAGLALLMFLAYRGVELLLAAPACALLVALTAGFAIFPQTAAEGAPSFTQAYMNGFVGFLSTWFFMFLLGSIFGKIMEVSGAADSVARWIVARIGARHAPLAVVLACAVLTYGGVTVFVVAFSVYPLGLSLFRTANLPRRFIAGCMAFGAATFTMTSAGSPEIQNWIPIKFLGTTPYAAWEVSLVVAIFMAAFGSWWLVWMVRRAVARGERFQARSDDPVVAADQSLPAVWRALLPLLAVLAVAFVGHDAWKESALILALGAGCLVALACHWRAVRRQLGPIGVQGSLGALIAIANTSAVVGFGGVAKLTAGFQAATAAVTSLPGDPLVSAAIAVTLIAGLAGSSSGGQSIALPLLAPHYLGQGVDPSELHRVVAISSGGLDSLPHNGAVVTMVRVICRESYAAAYPAVGILTVIVPLLGTVLALLLFRF